MTALNGSKRRGRTPLTELQKAQNEAVRTFLEHKSEVEVICDLLQIKDFTNCIPRDKDVLKVYNNRLVIARQLVAVLDEKKELKANADPELAERIEALKVQEAQLYTDIYKLPELGATEKEWEEDFAPEDKVRGLGRPGLLPEMKMIRAENAMQEAQTHLHALEKWEDAQAFNVVAAATEKLARSIVIRQPGKPKLDELGKLDHELTSAQRRREVILNKKNAKATILSRNGVPMGRKATSPQVKLKTINSEIKDIKASIAAEEAKLDEIGLLKRKVKKIRDQARRLKLTANNERGKEKAATLKSYEAKRNQAARIDNEIQVLMESADNKAAAKPQAAPAPTNVSLETLSVKVAEELDKYLQREEQLRQYSRAIKPVTDAQSFPIPTRIAS